MSDDPWIDAEILSDKFFIEIGSSDFDTLLPLSKKGWKGIYIYK